MDLIIDTNTKLDKRLGVVNPFECNELCFGLKTFEIIFVATRFKMFKTLLELRNIEKN